MLLGAGLGEAAPVRLALPLTGASLLPPAPVHLRLTPEGVLRWARRSRLGWAWRDGAEVPLGEEREAYRLTLPGGETLSLAAPEYPLPAPARRGLFEVRQQGAAGLSAPARLIL